MFWEIDKEALRAGLKLGLTLSAAAIVCGVLLGLFLVWLVG